MPVTQTNEMLWHFISELKIFLDPKTPADQLDGRYDGKILPEDPYAPNPDDPRKFDPEELESGPTPLARLNGPDAPPVLEGFSPADVLEQLGVLLKKLPPLPKDAPFPDSDGGFSFGGRRIAVDYEPGGSETVASLRQSNMIDDSDMLLDARGGLGPDQMAYIESWQAAQEGAFDDMLDEAEDMVPQGVLPPMTGDTDDLVQFVLDQAEALKAGASTGEGAFGADARELTAGRYVDGELSGEPIATVETDGMPVSRLELYADNGEGGSASQTGVITGPSHGVGAYGETGGNLAQNAAGIVDVKEMCGSLIVEGDVFKLNAIIQINVLVDSDAVDVSEVPFNMVFGGGNEVHNIAEYIVEDRTQMFNGAAGTPYWNVDVFHGDFHDFHCITQTNTLKDGDVLSQYTDTTYYGASTGDNEQVNLLKFIDLSKYDVIIIGGNYYSTNLILQMNLVFDNDWVKQHLTTDADGKTALAHTGGNTLTNDATIEQYGAQDFNELNQEQRDLITALRNGDESLVPTMLWNLSGSADGQLDVLFIDGDYYDVNLIAQINMIYDADMLSQVVINPIDPQLALPEGADAALDNELGASTGNNTALNTAIIKDIGTLSGSQFAGGDVYEDSILIQANLVVDDDSIVVHDTNVLVPEVVAFLDHGSDQQDDAAILTIVTSTGSQTDASSNIMS
jgi:hypothetical protein